MNLSIVVPCYNEEGNVEIFYDEIFKIFKNKKIKYEIIFVNDGSTDKTINKLNELLTRNEQNIKVVNFSRNFGKEAAMYAGLKESTGKFVTIIDADLQQRPEIILQMLDILKTSDEYDTVAAYQKERKEGKILTFFKDSFYKIINSISSVRFVKGASDFRTFRRVVVDAILDISEYNRFSKGIFSYVGFKTYYDSYKVEERKGGTTKWNKVKLFNYAFDGIVAFSTKPLRFATYTGILTSFAAFIYLIVILVKTFTTGIDTPGYASLMCVMLFLGGIQLIFLGIIGEYLGKTYNETKRRPIFIARERIGFDEDFL